ncbi:hypothetical protein K435DRAFT_853581 [Dendrothele bispora CBS 962.96]|uniref:Uncharacterized protein n=1 Tax=Dendrothele bispora (strain CBS 962.96) TaxID=1314807 RepID=A0A4S8MFY1_DENBC|nr:hypothetical protein K435DRAFT_853581 [Dendrothele bispora CBS 962.96]
MATRTEVETETTTQDPINPPHPSQVPHNSGFSTYTPDGYWRRGTQPTRPNSETPSREVFQGEGRILRPSSAPPAKIEEGRDGTPDAPRIPPMHLPTPEPTGPRTRIINLPFTREGPRNYDDLRREVRAIDPSHTFRGSTNIPESVLEETRAQEVLTENTPDPRSPVRYRTPIPSPLELPPRRDPIPYSRRNELTQQDRSPVRMESQSLDGSPIRITEPLDSRDRVVFPSLMERRPSFTNPRSYQEQFESAMGSALEHNPATGSSQPKRYTTPREALEDVGRQCRTLGESLGVRNLSDMSLEDHIHAVRALAEAREADLPLWVAS